ncbi:30S ribosomal protein S8 [Candidatus Peribacteria bacterium]|nr:MAG: 30S ribosomal protein S8 [Candidatus Peribacteria bacterium]
MTYVNDPIGDLLTRIRNAQAAKRKYTTAPWSRMKQELCELLQREGMLQTVEVKGESPKLNLLVTFVPGKTLILSRVSKPGRRHYSGASELKPVLRGYGIAILTTSEGLLTDKEARKRNVGGEVLCTIA